MGRLFLTNFWIFAHNEKLQAKGKKFWAYVLLKSPYQIHQLTLCGCLELRNGRDGFKSYAVCTPLGLECAMALITFKFPKMVSWVLAMSHIIDHQFSMRTCLC